MEKKLAMDAWRKEIPISQQRCHEHGDFKIAEVWGWQGCRYDMSFVYKLELVEEKNDNSIIETSLF